MIRRPPRSTQSRSSAASDVYKRQVERQGPRGEAGARRRQAHAVGQQSRVWQRHRGTGGRLRLRRSRDRLQCPLSARHLRTTRQWHGRVPARRSGIAHHGARREGCIRPLRPHDDAGMRAEPREPDHRETLADDGTAPQRLFVSALKLTDFRNYASVRLELSGSPVVLVGDNGAGKTNVLEAVSLLGAGHGLRGRSYGELARKDGEGGFAIAATVVTRHGEVAI